MKSSLVLLFTIGNIAAWGVMASRLQDPPLLIAGLGVVPGLDRISQFTLYKSKSDLNWTYYGNDPEVDLIADQNWIGCISYIYISYFKHIYTGYKFNKYIVLQFGPVNIKLPNKLLQIS